MPRSSSGIHVVRKRTKSGDRFYCYAWRGGPCIYTQDDTRPVITPELVELAEQTLRRERRSANTLDAIIDAYSADIAYTRLADSTRAEYRQRLNQISERMGESAIASLETDLFRKEVIYWRDELADTPRAADRVVGMLSTVLSWAQDKALITKNHASGVRNLHKVNRAHLIWEPRHWQAVEDIPGHVHRALVLGSLTGLRLGDLLRLTWEQVGPDYIDVTTRKTGGLATVPMYAELARFLTGPGRGEILRNTRGEPWTRDGFQSSWQKAKPDGFDRKLHDLRGTFATRLMMAGFGDLHIASSMGWTGEKVAAIRARYVDRGRVARALAERLSA